MRRLDNDRCAIVKVNDRMHAKHRKRIIDVSRGVAEYLDMIRAGVVLVRVAPLKGNWRNGRLLPGVFRNRCREPAATKQMWQLRLTSFARFPQRAMRCD